MEKKYILGVIIIALLSINAVLVYDWINHDSSSTSSSNSVNINGISFEMPKDYSIGDDPNQIVLSNGSDKIIIFKLDGKDINELIKSYTGGYSNNYSISVKDFDADVDCKKTVSKNDNYTIAKYWFKADNNNIYQIQMNGDNSKNDDIARNLINSISK